MRIVIDLQGMQSASRHRGIGRYSFLFVTNVLALLKEEDVWVVLNENLLTYEDNLIAEMTQYIQKNKIVKYKLPLTTNESNPDNLQRAKAAAIIREHFLASLSPDLVVLTSLFEGYHDNAVVSVNQYFAHIPTAVILYDLIPLVHEEKYLKTQEQKDFYHNKITSLKKADIYLSISKYSKQEAQKLLHIDEEKIITIHTAIDDSFRAVEMLKEEKEDFFQHYKLKEGFIFYAPGGFDMRKNFKNLIEAYAKLPQELRIKHQLVIASKITDEAKIYLDSLAQQNDLDKTEFLLLGYVNDADLKALYTFCKIFIFPSYHEGFGLPILEAISCGAAVICSNTTGIPEVINNEEALFDPFSVDSIHTKLYQTLTSEDFLLALKKQAYYRVKSFSPQRLAQTAKEALLMLGSKTKTALHVNRQDLLQTLKEQKLQCTQEDKYQIANAIATNQRVMNKPQLLVDISKLAKVDAKSGIQRVVRSILASWMNDINQERFDIQAVYFDKTCYKYANRFCAKYFKNKPDIPDMPIEFNTQDVYISLDLNADIINETNIWHKHFKKIGMQVHYIVYDILPVTNPHWWPQGTSEVFVNWLHTISKNATSLICISKAVEDELQQWLHVNTAAPFPKTSYFHLGADLKNSLPSKGYPDNAQQILKILQTKPSFAMIGTIEPRKGHAQTIKAFEILWQEGYDINLVIVGKKGWLIEELYEYILSHPKKDKQLFLLESISDEYLEDIYTASTAVLIPSEAEGFGLPLIEAAQKKKPVIARDIPVFREIAGESICYFENKLEPEVIAESMKEWLKNEKTMLHIDNIKYLTWQQSARKLLELFDI